MSDFPQSVPPQIFPRGAVAAIGAALHGSFSTLLEEEPETTERSAITAAFAPPFLRVSLTTATAWELELARHLARRIGENTGIAPAQVENLELALQEAIANALIHGNLQLASITRCSPVDLNHFNMLLNQRLRQTPYADRRLQVSASWTEEQIEVRVEDEGAGYIPVPVALSDCANTPSGRGLAIIRRLADHVQVLKGGKLLTLLFARHP